MELYKVRDSAVVSREIELMSEMVIDMTDEYKAYVVDDEEYWVIHFVGAEGYVASGTCESEVGSCVEYIMNNKYILASKLDSGSFL